MYACFAVKIHAFFFTDCAYSCLTVCTIDGNYIPIQISSPGGAVLYEVTAGFLDII